MTVLLVKSGPCMIEWASQELENMDGRKRKIIHLYGSIGLRVDVDRLYVNRDVDGKEQMSILDTVQQYKKQNIIKYMRDKYCR